MTPIMKADSLSIKSRRAAHYFKGVLVKVTCPSCNATGNVDTSKMPPGANLKCPKCGNSFPLPFDDGPSIGDTGGGVGAGSGAAATMNAQPPSPPEPAPGAGSAGSAATLYAPPSPPTPGNDALATPTTTSADATDLGAGTRLAFSGRGGELFGIFIVNLLLTLVTLSFYRFWGKVKIRKYIYSHCELLGERLAYHGTGMELFIGWLKAAGIVIVLVVIVNGSQMLSLPLAVVVIVQIIALLAFYYLMVLAMVGSKRYRLSRTSWYGIRFSFRGRVNEALKIFVVGGILTSITFGIYAPWFYAAQHRFWISNSHFGNKPFKYEGKGGELFLIFLIAGLIYFGGIMAVSIIIPLIIGVSGGAGDPGGGAAALVILMPFLIILALGFAYAFFRARTDRYHWSKTTYEGVSFESTFTTGKLLGFYITNALILIFTLGLGLPLVMIRILNFRFDNLIMTGAVDLDGIKQDAQEVTTTGEGLADFLDLDGGLF